MSIMIYPEKMDPAAVSAHAAEICKCEESNACVPLPDNRLYAWRF